MTDALHREEFLAGYVAEVQEHLAAARRAALAADEAVARGQPVPRPTRELFRALHTIKGLSGMIGVEPIVDLAHEMEAVLRTADRAGGRLPRAALDALLHGLEAIEERVGQVARREPVAPAPRSLLEALARLDAPAQPGPALSHDLPGDLAAKLGPAELEQLAGGVTEGRRAVRIDFAPSPERAARGLDISAVRRRVEALAEIVKVVPRSLPRDAGAPAGLVFALVVLTSAPPQELAAAAEAPLEAVRDIRVEEASGGPADAPEAAAPDAAAPQAFVRVEVARLDEALEHVSALIVSRARLARQIEALGAAGADVRPLRALLQDHGRELRLLRTAVMRSRLVRVAEILARAPLLVRGLAQSSRKQVRLGMAVGEAEVDKGVGERLFPALVHLLRNAVDHAIEPPEERRAAGKPEEGTIRIAASHRGEGELELTISDDGRGIDRAEVARRAGVPVPATSGELLDLISRPGLSTARAASRTSGRGIGMDVVRRVVVTELGGTLDLSTSAAGTTFTLRVPVSLTIVDGLTFACAGETYVVPTAAVDELVDVEAEQLVSPPAPGRDGLGVRMLRWRAETVPFFDLGEVLGLARAGAGRKGIILKRDGAAVGFGVDRMLGRQEVVIRSVRDPLIERVGIAGATDLGDGRPTLVLDLAALARTLPVTAREKA